MQEKSSISTKPVVTYSSLVGKILARERELRRMKQGDLALAVGLSQSAYSRLESGESVLNLSQLRNVCTQLGVSPAAILSAADQCESELRRQNVDVISEKPNNPAAIAIGLGLLAAILLSRS
jgi:transcriptional regulator with XRE-family HTH domain